MWLTCVHAKGTAQNGLIGKERTMKKDEAKAGQQRADVKASATGGDVAARAKKSKKATKDAKAATKRHTGKRAAKGAKRPSGLDAAAKILAQADKPMGCKDMVEQMLAKGMWKTKGKTPEATIYAAIIREIAKRGPNSRFRKVARGRFTAAK